MKEFENYLIKENLAKRTITSYVFAVKNYFKIYEKISKRNLLAFKSELIENFKPQTVNVKLNAINKYLDFTNNKHLKLKLVKFQQRNFLDNVISDADYKFLKNQLKKDNKMQWYFVVRYLACTGARIGELVQLKIEHVEKGYYDIYAKGGKIRRLYIAKKLRDETLTWLNKKSISSGYLFLNKYGNKMTVRGISKQLKNFAFQYGINPNVVYPHSFRHRFAKNFLEKYNDISFLADLMGHESIETTRIYLRRTSTEQREIVDKIITW